MMPNGKQELFTTWLRGRATADTDIRYLSIFEARMELLKGNEPSYSAWKSLDFRNVFQKPSRYFADFWAIEITTEFLFVELAVASRMLVLFKPFDGNYEPNPRDFSRVAPTKNQSFGTHKI